MPKVSVIVPVYNAGKYIEECLTSIIRQTLNDIEIIVINDGSTDNSEQIIRNTVLNDNRVRIVTQENKGLYVARKVGISIATGEYIGWVDADDYIEPNMYEILYRIAETNKSELVYCDYSFFPKRGKHKEKWFREYKGCLDVNYVELNSQPWNKIVKRELLDSLNIASKFETCFDEIYIEVMLKAKNPISIEDKLYHYRMGHVTMSRTFNDVHHYVNFVHAATALKEEMKDYWCDSIYWKQYFEFREIYYMLITMLIASNAGDRDTYLAMKSELNSYGYNYKKNMHIKNILDTNNGILKSFAIRNIVGLNYRISRLMCKIAL